MKKFIDFCRLYPGEMLFILCAIISLSAVICCALLFSDALAAVTVILAFIFQAICGYLIPARNASLSYYFHLPGRLWLWYYILFSMIVIIFAIIMDKIELYIPLCIALGVATARNDDD